MKSIFHFESCLLLTKHGIFSSFEDAEQVTFYCAMVVFTQERPSFVLCMHYDYSRKSLDIGLIVRVNYLSRHLKFLFEPGVHGIGKKYIAFWIDKRKKNCFKGWKVSNEQVSVCFFKQDSTFRITDSYHISYYIPCIKIFMTFTCYVKCKKQLAICCNNIYLFHSVYSWFAITWSFSLAIYENKAMSACWKNL